MRRTQWVLALALVRPTTLRGMSRLRASLIGVTLVLAACSPADDVSAARSADASTSTITSSTTTADASIDSAGAEATILFLQGLSRGWNDNALTWISAYSDPHVGWEEFLRVQQDVLVAQGSLIAMAELQVSGLPSDVQGPVRDVVEHYSQRLDAFYGLAIAIVAGDLAAEEDAATAYNAISNASVITPLLEELFRAPTIRSTFEAEGVDPDDLLAAVMGAVPER